MAAKPPQETTETNQAYLERLTAKVDRAYKRLSCRERTTPRQQQMIKRLFSLRARCLAEHHKELRPGTAEAARPEARGESSAIWRENSDKIETLLETECTETKQALGWHDRLFGED